MAAAATSEASACGETTTIVELWATFKFTLLCAALLSGGGGGLKEWSQLSCDAQQHEELAGRVDAVFARLSHAGGGAGA